LFRVAAIIAGVSWTPRAVIFDFDGVLADTEGLHLGAFQQVFAARGWPLDRHAYFDRYLGYDDRGLLRAYAADHGLRIDDAEARALLRDKEATFRARAAAGDVLYPGVHACLDRLGARFRLGVATGALRAEVLDILTGAGIASRFGTVVAADDVRSSKPSPEPYVAAAARLGLDPAECAAIEDSGGGLASALGAGMRTVGITTTLPARALSAAHVIVDRLDAITVELIESLAAGSTRVVG
jgi:HAD superfamily hydrolase (TIGR01509 family)